MRAAAGARLERFGERVEVRDFDLGNADWLPALDGAGVVLSSLVIHHLDDAEKQTLFGQVRKRISVGGAFLIADIVHPGRPEVNSMFARSYEAEVKTRSVGLTGDLRLWERFDQEHWNHYQTPTSISTSRRSWSNSSGGSSMPGSRWRLLLDVRRTCGLWGLRIG